MQESITVTLAEDLKEALDKLTRAEGISREELIQRAVKQHLFLRNFRSLRERMAAKAQSQGIVTDQDVFDRIS